MARDDITTESTWNTSSSPCTNHHHHQQQQQQEQHPLDQQMGLKSTYSWLSDGLTGQHHQHDATVTVDVVISRRRRWMTAGRQYWLLADVATDSASSSHVEITTYRGVLRGLMYPLKGNKLVTSSTINHETTAFARRIVTNYRYTDGLLHFRIHLRQRTLYVCPSTFIHRQTPDALEIYTSWMARSCGCLNYTTLRCQSLSVYASAGR